MVWYKTITYLSIIICLTGILWHLVRLIRMGMPNDFSKKSGDVVRGIKYSFTGAMNPIHKESAYLHLPTYTAGVVFHLGTFLSLALFLLFLFRVEFPNLINLAILLLLAISSLCGIGILIKRVVSPTLRGISNADDFISNILVTMFQVATALQFWGGNIEIVYSIIASTLLICLPFSKLKHAVYFFAARYHIGFFYGWRGVWPPLKHNS